MAHRVLVIDDSQTIRKLVELSFRTLPFVVEYATSGTDGMNKARANPPDVVLLDVVLPDMQGLDVCRQLSREANTSQTPIVLMTAKDVAIKEQFTSFNRVVGFLHKPFTAQDLMSRIDTARQSIQERPATPKRNIFSFEQKQAIAKDLYGHLKSSFALIPEWAREMGSAQPASYFARKILTPELIEELIGSIGTHFEAASKTQKGDAGPLEPGSLSGSVTGFPLFELLHVLAQSKRTGQLMVAAHGRKTWMYFRQGTLVLATHDAPQDYVRGSGVELGTVAADARTRAETEQAKTGKPLFVSLAESGQLPSGSLSRVLYQQGKVAVIEALDAAAAFYSFTDLPALPLYVEAQGREISFGQLKLEQLRRASSTLVGEKGADATQWVFERVSGFSRKLRQFSLTPDERRVLTLIDGRYSVAKVIRRSGIAPSTVSSVLHRLVEIELIRRTDSRPTGARRLVLIDPDVEGVQRPLEWLLTHRREPVELVTVKAEESDLVSAIVRERPRLLLVDASTLGERAIELGRKVFEAPQLSHMSSVAMLENRDPQALEALTSAGFDAVFFKPVWFGDIERLLNE